MKSILFKSGKPDAFMRSPKACVSCQQYAHLGFDEDKHCPFAMHSSLQHKPSRTPYGRCDRHGVQVFATQICNSHTPDPHIECFEATNRPEPRVAIQESMLLDGEPNAS
ncbi:hypothetical protein ACT3OH_01760 [Vreelandella zhanjiangensis]|uniref:hypothetical protein n=1 Tax=Vreelandella zhanjiangensis TaxID=1121960 RepID=UPI00402AA47A